MSTSSSTKIPFPFTLSNAFCLLKTTEDKIKQTTLRLLHTIDQIKAGKLTTSSIETGDGSYYRKSLNSLCFPVLTNELLGAKYVIVKYQLQPTAMPELKDALAKGALKKVYIAVRVIFQNAIVHDLDQALVYAWAKGIIPNSEKKDFIANIFSSDASMMKRAQADLVVTLLQDCTFKGKNSEQRVGFLMEFCPNDLGKIEFKKYFSSLGHEAQKVFIIKLTAMLVHLQSCNVVHRDIKHQNILLDFQNEPKLADFGFSKDTTQRLTNCAGSNGYIAPERVFHNLIREKIKIAKEKGEVEKIQLLTSQLEPLSSWINNPKTDVWSMGIVIYTLLFKSHPFLKPGQKQLLVMENKKETLKRFNANMEKRKNSPFFTLISGMLNFNPEERFDAVQCEKAAKSVLCLPELSLLGSSTLYL